MAVNAGILTLFRRAQERRGLSAKTIHQRSVLLRQFGVWMDGRYVCEATPADVEGWLDSRPIGMRTRYIYLSHLHAFYSWAVEYAHVVEDPTRKIDRPKLRRTLPRPATTADLTLALAQASPKHRAWLLLAALEGLRCQEIAGLRREDVDDRNGLLRVLHGKGGHERVLPLHPLVADGLRDMPMPRVGWLFLRPDGMRYTPTGLSNDLNLYLRNAQVDFTAHQLRHWFGTELYRSTHDLRLVQEMLGHASPTTTSIYVAFDRTAARDAVGSLGFGGDAA